MPPLEGPSDHSDVEMSTEEEEEYLLQQAIAASLVEVSSRSLQAAVGRRGAVDRAQADQLESIRLPTALQFEAGAQQPQAPGGEHRGSAL